MISSQSFRCQLKYMYNSHVSYKAVTPSSRVVGLMPLARDVELVTSMILGLTSKSAG